MYPLNISKMNTPTREHLTATHEREADIVIAFPHDAKETTVLWFREKLESIPGIILTSKPLSTSVNRSKSMKLARKTCQAFYVKGTYECYLRGLEHMNIKKPLKDEYGGGDKSFVFKELACYKDIGNLDTFLTGQERQGVLIFIINRLRAQEGIYFFIYVSILLFWFYF